MNTLTKCFLSALAGAAACTVAALGVAKCTNAARFPVPQVVRDTTVIHDTVRIDRPVAKLVRTTDTVLIFATDTVRVSDTLYVRVPIETKTYADSTFRAQVSGYRPALDWIEVYPRTVTITETATREVTKKTRWGIGVQVGYGAALSNKQVVLSPYIGVGVSYNILRW